MRWLFVAQDGWGLGHVSRQLGLARELRRLRPGDEMLFLTYSDATHLIAAEGFASVKLPSPEWFKPADKRRIDDLLRLRVATAVVGATATTYQPEAVVIDTFPVGNRGEFAILRRVPCARFLITREVVNPLPQWEYHESLPRFTALIAPYAEGEIALKAPDGIPLHWVGPIMVRSRDDLLGRNEARRRLDLPQEGRVCLVAFGGGGNPIYARLEAWVRQLAAQHPAWCFAFATPPLLQGAVAEAGAENIRRFAYYPVAECYSAFDAAISTVGSSSYELASMGVPSILVTDVSPQQDEDFPLKAQRIVGANGGFVVRGFDTPALESAFAAMDDPARLAAMTADRAALKLENGARTAAALLARYTAKIASQGA
jgi:UDP:flavonoid glycosyltransferase YjiC (YdhE family)